jgi:hypothetical protein
MSDACPAEVNEDLFSGFRDRSPVPFALRNSDSRFSILRDPLPRVLYNGRSRSAREIAYRDFDMQQIYTPQISDGKKIPDASQTLTRVLPKSTAYGISTPDLMAQITSSHAYPCA